MLIERLLTMLTLADAPAGSSARLATVLFVIVAALLVLFLLGVVVLTLGRRQQNRPAGGDRPVPIRDPWRESARRIFVDPPPDPSPPSTDAPESRP